MRRHAAMVLLAAAAWMPAGWAEAGEAVIVAELQQQITRCWVLPASADKSAAPVTLTFKLNSDGSLDGLPLMAEEEKLAGDRKMLATSASRAIKACQPYRLPAEDYDIWKDVKITFRVPGD